MHSQKSPVAQIFSTPLTIPSANMYNKDIMVAMGFVPESQDTLGIEATGVITRVGAAVGSLKVGARVCVLANGLLATRKVVPARLVLPIPHSLSFEEAVTLPVAYVTVLHAIMNLGQLARGQVRKAPIYAMSVEISKLTSSQSPSSSTLLLEESAKLQCMSATCWEPRYVPEMP